VNPTIRGKNSATISFPTLMHGVTTPNTTATLKVIVQGKNEPLVDYIKHFN